MIAPSVFAGAAHAAPPPTDPEGPPPTAEEHPLPAQGSDPHNGEAPAAIPPPGVVQVQNEKRNPQNALPGDVVFPRLNRDPVVPIIWKPEWARFKTSDWVIMGTATAITIASAIIPPLKKHVAGTLGIDDSVRNAIRFGTVEGRYVARDTSDVLLSLEATWPLFVDALITTWWYRASPDAAAEMALVDGQTLALTTAVQGVTNVLVSRERPYGQNCGSPAPEAQGLPNASSDCDGNSRYRSFFSGHTAFSFMSAGLICVHHEKLGLYGGGWPDHLACVIAEVGAATTGMMRVVGDMHYVSDVAVGAAVGTLFGVGIPMLHYRKVHSPALERAGINTLEIMPVGTGVGVGGTF